MSEPYYEEKHKQKDCNDGQCKNCEDEEMTNPSQQPREEDKNVQDFVHKHYVLRSFHEQEITALQAKLTAMGEVVDEKWRASMTDSARSEAASTYPEHSHDEMYLTWNQQGDGFNYFKCEICGWKKPDMNCPIIATALQQRDERIKDIEQALTGRTVSCEACNGMAEKLAHQAELLRKFGEHIYPCPVIIHNYCYPNNPLPCNCGLSALLTSITDAGV